MAGGFSTASLAFRINIQMDKVIIDTNILYSVVGLSQNNKVSSDLASKYALWTTTVTLIEAITKYRSDLNSLKQVLTPILSESIKLISIGHAPLSNKVISKIVEANSITSISREINDVVELKINREAEFLRWIFVIVIAGLFDVLKTSDGYSFTDVEKNNIQLYLVKSLLESNEAFVLDYFKDKIQEGYNTGNEQKVVLEAFHEMLLSSLNIFHFNYHQVKTGVIHTTGISKDEKDITKLKESLSNDKFFMKIRKHIDNPLSLLSKKKLHEPIDRYLSTIKNGLKDEKNLTESAIDFLILKIESGFKNQAKIRKNDIFDFLQIFSLGLSGYKIITLDKSFINLLKDVDKNSWDLIHYLGYDKKS